MLDRLLANEYLFWFAAFGLYFHESLRLCMSSKGFLSESFTGSLRPHISSNPITIFGKELHLLNPLSPQACFFLLEKKYFSDPKKNYLRESRRLRLFQKYMMPFRWISMFSFTYLILGIYITSRQGLGTALLNLLLGHLLLLCFTFWMLITKRKRLNLTTSQSLTIFFEILVVPSYMATLVKKICDKQEFDCDAYLLALSQHNVHPADKNKIIETIIAVQEEFDTSSRDFATIESYKKCLGLSDERR